MRINDCFDPSDGPDDIDLKPSEAADLAAYLFGTRLEIAGLRIGKYTVIREIGRGGHGVVLLANQEGAETLVAIKVIRRSLADPAAPRRLWRELESLERCQSSAVPRLLEYGTHEGNLFIVYEYIDGESLDEHIRRLGSSVREKIAVLAKVCDAVQGLHEYGIIHRDLKPSNLLVTRSGEIRIIDLGTACLLEGRAEDTRTMEGTILGTPACMAPEQARGEVSRLSTRSDVFSLGAIGYLVLSGQTPFSVDGTPHEVLRRVAEERPRRLKELESSVPSPLAAVFTKAVEPNPRDRFGTVAELREELTRWLEGSPTQTAAPGPIRRFVLLARRKPLGAFAVAAIVVLSIVAVFASASAYSNAQVADQRQQLLLEHAALLKQVGEQAQMAIDAGYSRGAIVQLVVLGKHLKKEGELEEGLITFSEGFDAIIERYEDEHGIMEED